MNRLQSLRAKLANNVKRHPALCFGPPMGLFMSGFMNLRDFLEYGYISPARFLFAAVIYAVLYGFMMKWWVRRQDRSAKTDVE